MASSFDPFGDRCGSGDECGIGRCTSFGICGCEDDPDCRSGSCVNGLCANPDHDPQLTSGLATPSRSLRTLCPGLPQEEPEPGACQRIIELVHSTECPDSCFALDLEICACRTGGALYDCLDRLAGARSSSSGGHPGEAEQDACAEALDDFDCRAYQGLPGALCGRPTRCLCPDGRRCDEATVCLQSSECTTGVCMDQHEENNLSLQGDDPLDWRCVQPCSDDLDCPARARCDPLSPLGDGRNACRRRHGDAP